MTALIADDNDFAKKTGNRINRIFYLIYAV